MEREGKQSGADNEDYGINRGPRLPHVRLTTDSACLRISISRQFPSAPPGQHHQRCRYANTTAMMEAPAGWLCESGGPPGHISTRSGPHPVQSPQPFGLVAVGKQMHHRWLLLWVSLVEATFGSFSKRVNTQMSAPDLGQIRPRFRCWLRCKSNEFDSLYHYLI